MLRIADRLMKWLRFYRQDKSNPINLMKGDEPEVQQALKNAHQEVLTLQARIEEFKWLDGALRSRTRELNERMKELDCLYSLFSYAANHSFTLDQLLEFVIKQIPLGWQNRQATLVRIVLDRHEYQSLQFRQTTRKQSADINQNGRKIGTLEIYVLPEMMKNHERPFLNEKQKLLNAVALWIGGIVGHKRMMEDYE